MIDISSKIMIKLNPCTPDDYKFVYSLVENMFKTNLNVTYLKLENFDEFVSRAFSEDDIHYIILNEKEEKMGHIHIMSNNEIGYAIIKKFQNKGIGTEAVQKIIKLHPRERYFLTIHNQNKASIRIAEKNGFNAKGTIFEKIN
jgi:RimJ/RimL family protein N-acetyltransferase